MLALCIAATACGSSGTAQTSPSDPVSSAVSTAPAPPTSTIPEGALDLAAPRGTFPEGLIAGFQAASGCQVAVQDWPASGDPAPALRRRLGGIDLVSVRADRLRPLAIARLVVPVETGNVDGLGGVASGLRSLRAGSFDGKSYAVPYVWEPMVLLTRDDGFTDGPPTSLRVLWEPARSAVVALPDDPLTLATAALSVGVDDPFSVAASDLASADELLRLARPAYRWRTNAGLEELFRSGEVQVALGSPRVAIALRRHPRISVTLPSEGAVGLVRALALPAHAPHPVCAYRFLSYVLQPGPQAAVAIATGLTPVVRAACGPLGRRRCVTLHANDQWGTGVQFAHRPVGAVAPWARWVSDWRALAP